MSSLLDAESAREFINESREYIATLNKDLLEMEDKGAELDMAFVDDSFRAIHTIKGLAGMLGLDEIKELAHAMEDVLDCIRASRLAVGGDVSQSLFDALDLLTEMVESSTAETDYSKYDTKKHIERLHNLDSSGNDKRECDGPNTLQLVLSLAEDFAGKKRSMLNLINKVREIGEVVAISPEDYEKTLRSRRKLVDLMLFAEFKTELSSGDVAEKLKIDPAKIFHSQKEEPVKAEKAELQEKETAQVQAGSNGKTAAESIRVDVEKLDHILSLVGELVITRSRYNHVANQAVGDLLKSVGKSRRIITLQSELNEVESSMSRTLNDLQDAVMKARLVPIGSVFGSFQRSVRDIAKEVGKSVDFKSKGGETELDKKVIEQIREPILHLVRNAIDHGIESTERRKALKKPAKGQISLIASQEGDKVVIEVADDGSGLKREQILTTAIEHGLTTYEEAEELTDFEIQDLISQPGFSTKNQVTSLSGRGVGLDAVNSALSNLKGYLELRSFEDKGSSFKIKLPLTMAIMDALLVGIKDESYAISVSTIKEIIELDSNDIYVVGGRECFREKGKVFPLVRLEEVLATQHQDISSRDENTVYTAVIVSAAGEYVAILVDRVIGQQEIVIKALSQRFEYVTEISGGSVLGDGSVCLIIDVPSLVSAHRMASIKQGGE